MAKTTAVSGQPYKNEGGTMSYGGSSNTSVKLNVIPYTYNGIDAVNKPRLVSGYTAKAFNWGNFAHDQDLPISFQITSSLAGSGTSWYLTSAELIKNRSFNNFSGYRAYGITSITMSGTVTKGATAGSGVTLRTDNEISTAGEWTMMKNGYLADNYDFS